MTKQLHEYGRDLAPLAEKLDELRCAQSSLAFCRDVYRAYRIDGRPANEHMDAEKAQAQLLYAIDRVLRV
jgi:hypothetical protein